MEPNSPTNYGQNSAAHHAGVQTCACGRRTVMSFHAPHFTVPEPEPTPPPSAPRPVYEHGFKKAFHTETARETTATTTTHVHAAHQTVDSTASMSQPTSIAPVESPGEAQVASHVCFCSQRSAVAEEAVTSSAHMTRREANISADSSIQAIPTTEPAALSTAQPRVRRRPKKVVSNFVFALKTKLGAAVQQRRALDRPVSEKNFSFSQIALYGMALILFGAGALLTVQSVRTNQHVAAQVTQLQQAATPSRDTTVNQDAQTSATSQPDSASALSMEKPTAKAIANYSVAPNHIKYIDIVKFSIHARVVSVSVDKDNILSVPTNGYDVGWYDGSALPGQSGAVLLEGHRNILGKPALFASLDKLVTGDKILLTRGDGAVLSYRVVSVITSRENGIDMGSMMVSVDPARSGLNIITCGGKVEPGSLKLDSRTLVRAVME